MYSLRTMLYIERQRSDAVRTEPVFLDGNGHAFWRLKGFGDANILQGQLYYSNAVFVRVNFRFA